MRKNIFRLQKKKKKKKKKKNPSYLEESVGQSQAFVENSVKKFLSKMF